MFSYFIELNLSSLANTNRNSVDDSLWYNSAYIQMKLIKTISVCLITLKPDVTQIRITNKARALLSPLLN